MEIQRVENALINTFKKMYYKRIRYTLLRNILVRNTSNIFLPNTFLTYCITGEKTYYSPINLKCIKIIYLFFILVLLLFFFFAQIHF